MQSLAGPWVTRSHPIVVAGLDGITAISDADADSALLAASQILFNLTGGRWAGEATDAFRPNRLIDCGCALGRPGCHQVTELRLPGYPVLSVVEVMQDGSAVSDAFYRVDDYRWLVFVPDPDNPAHLRWPCCQRMDRPLTEADTFGITYTWGETPDATAIRQAASLGVELAKAGCPAAAGSCRLPSATTTAITRQGVSKVIDSGIFSQGRTGLDEVDLWLGSLPKLREQTAGRIIDPYALGRGRRARRTSWLPGS